jgi:signal transduction histidine kinase
MLTDYRYWLAFCAVAGAYVGTAKLGLELSVAHGVFEVFDRGPSDSSQVTGAGVGLAIVAQAAALHGGTVRVDDREGGGASFSVRLPLHPGSSIRA